jgi:hypothetical protein
MIVTVTLRYGFISTWPLDKRLALWLASLAALTTINVGSWLALAHFASLRTPYGKSQLVLSGLYVSVCGFRALFPRVDLERVCVWDTWLSAIALGRTAATIAELCFAVQCALCVQRLSELTNLPHLSAGAHVFVPLVVFAEAVCWYAVLSLNHIGHAIEESLWALLMLLLSLAFGTAALATQGLLREMLIVGTGVYAVASGVTFAFDVRMYLERWRLHAGGDRLTLVTGLRDISWRRHATAAWDDWRAEVPWMTLYFSIGVWTSLAMVLLERAAALR